MCLPVAMVRLPLTLKLAGLPATVTACGCLRWGPAWHGMIISWQSERSFAMAGAVDNFSQLPMKCVGSCRRTRVMSLHVSEMCFMGHSERYWSSVDEAEEPLPDLRVQ